MIFITNIFLFLVDVLSSVIHITYCVTSLLSDDLVVNTCYYLSNGDRHHHHPVCAPHHQDTLLICNH